LGWCHTKVHTRVLLRSQSITSNSLCAKKVDALPHLTPPQKWVMNQECQRKGNKNKTLVHIPEVSRTDSGGNNPWALNSMVLIPKRCYITSSSSNSIKIRNMLKPTSSCLVQLCFVGYENECVVLCMRLRNYIHRIQSPVLLLLLALLSTSSNDNCLI
jgi:hypothetical protein